MLFGFLSFFSLFLEGLVLFSELQGPFFDAVFLIKVCFFQCNLRLLPQLHLLQQVLINHVMFDQDTHLACHGFQ